MCYGSRMQAFRHRWTIAALALLVGVGLGLGAMAWRYDDLVRDVVWPAVAQRPLSDGEREDLAACRPVGWWTWLRILEQDVPSTCGVAWAREGLAARLGSAGRRAWLQERLMAQEGSVRTRWRIAVALEAAGEAPAVEPGWLLLEAGWAEEDLATIRAHDPVDAFGPRAGARARAWRVRAGGEVDEADLRALERLARVPGPDAEAAAAAAAWLGWEALPPVDARRLGHRLPASWSRAVRPLEGCVAPCAVEAIAVVRQLRADPDGLDQPEDGQGPDATLGWLGLLPVDDAERAALADGLDRDGAWVAAAVAPGRRLRSLLREGAPEASWTARAYTGRWRPHEGALYLAEVGRRAGLEVVFEAGPRSLRMRVGGEVHALCGAGDAEPVPTEWIVAWALDEGGRSGAARRLVGASGGADAAGAIGRALWSPTTGWRARPCEAFTEG